MTEQNFADIQMLFEKGSINLNDVLFLLKLDWKSSENESSVDELRKENELLRKNCGTYSKQMLEYKSKIDKIDLELRKYTWANYDRVINIEIDNIINSPNA